MAVGGLRLLSLGKDDSAPDVCVVRDKVGAIEYSGGCSCCFSSG